MASNITLSYFGPPEQKHVIKVPPMQTLSQVLEAAASKFKPALVPQQCSLQYNKKQVDLNTPFRLLNVPAGSKLEVIISRPQKVAPSAAPAAPSAPAAQQVAHPSVQPSAASTAAPTPAAPAALQTPAPTAAAAAPAAKDEQSQAGRAAAAAAAPSPAVAPPAAEATAAQAEASAGPSSTATAAPVSASDPPSSSPLAALGVTGQVYVFHQRTLEAAAAAATGGPSAMELDPPDDFFELTTDDLVRLQQQANEKKRQEAQFKPRALREAEEAARAATLGPVRVRLHFPDATIVQASFNATQPLSAVHQLVTQLALDAVAPALYLYTTPPKTVLKDPTATLYQLKLVPAAHVYVGCEVKRLKGSAQAAVAAGSYPGPFLRPEVMALMQDSVPQQDVPPDAAAHRQQGSSSAVEASAADAQRVLAAAAAASRAEGTSSRSAAGSGGAKVPKWMKMGK